MRADPRRLGTVDDRNSYRQAKEDGIPFARSYRRYRAYTNNCQDHTRAVFEEMGMR